MSDTSALGRIYQDFERDQEIKREIRELEEKLGYLPGESKKSKDQLVQELGDRKKQEYEKKKQLEKTQEEAERYANELYPNDKTSREIFINGFVTSRQDSPKLVAKTVSFKITIDMFVPENQTSLDTAKQTIQMLKNAKSPLAEYCNIKNCIEVKRVE